jgi:nucleoside-diphosphate-sugar epimerase
MRILVTGAGGYLGGVIAERLRAAGADVIGTRRPALEAEGPFDAVVHCAAELPGKLPDSQLVPINRAMTYHLAEWALKRGVGRFVLASGCNVYGPVRGDTPETAALDPSDTYAQSKAESERVLTEAARGTGMKACILRISAPYGPRLQRETVIRRFLLRAASGETMILSGSGAREQDFVFEDDVAEAFLAALDRSVSGIFNIAGGAPVGMRKLAESVARIFGLDPAKAVRCEGEDPQEEYRGRFPIDAAREHLGYRPRTGLEEGLRKTARAWGLI